MTNATHKCQLVKAVVLQHLTRGLGRGWDEIYVYIKNYKISRRKINPAELGGSGRTVSNQIATRL